MKTKDIQILTILTFIALFAPQLQSQFGLLLEQMLSILLCGYTLILLIINKQSVIKISAIFISLIFIFLLSLSLIRSLNIFIFNDLFELAKPIYFGSFFFVAYNVKWNHAKLCRYFSNLMVLLILAALIGVGESLNSSINTITTILYKGTRGVLSYKAIFSFISPYVFGSILLLPIFYYFIKTFKSKNKFFLIDLSRFLLLLTCFILTQSRTVLIGFVLTLFILFLLIICNKWYPDRKKLIMNFSVIIIVIIVSIPFMVLFVQKNLSYLYIGLDVFFKSLKHLENFNIEDLILANPTLALRYKQLLFAVANQDKIPLIGIGIGKAVLMPESFYAMYYYRTGLIGTGIHFGIVFYVIYWSFYFARKYAKLNLNIDNNFLLTAIFLAITIYFISFFFSYISSAINDQTRSGYIFYTLVAIVCYYKNHYRTTRR